MATRAHRLARSLVTSAPSRHMLSYAANRRPFHGSRAGFDGWSSASVLAPSGIAFTRPCRPPGAAAIWRPSKPAGVKRPSPPPPHAPQQQAVCTTSDGSPRQSKVAGA